ncbi:MAG TPA: site-specific DNA-methyltransferase [Acidimicrobiales bacterium]|nr:site-specific DNA-methyltransferase [Acidimicrobiales bacterium]
MEARRGTTTSNFGVGRRENHDATAFYDRFRGPDVSTDDTVLAPVPVVEPLVHGDARQMDAVADGSVALVVTSPPYFAGKQYEEELQREGVPGSYLEFLTLLTEVFAECARKLEPGGRIAVNVANLGRKPYRSLSADVIRILQDDLGLLLRGEVIWQKSEGASGSCAWGSYRSAANPVLRDVTERVIIASKGRFDRALTTKQRAAAGLPHVNTVSTDDFMNLTLDVWSIPPESAKRVGHPAPFPIELPEQLIRLLTYEDDLVLDPFVGSGSALVAAKRLGRRYVGYDTDADYLAVARDRLAITERLHEPAGDVNAHHLAHKGLADAGFTITKENYRVPRAGVVVDFRAVDGRGRDWLFYVAGPFTSHRPGLQKMDAVWRALGVASAARGRLGDVRFVVLAPSLPKRPSEGDTVMRSAGPEAFFDAIALLDDADRARLAAYATGDAETPSAGFWTAADLNRPF